MSKHLLQSLKQRCDRWLHAPITELTLIGLILLSIVLVFMEAGLEYRGGSDRYILRLQAALTLVFLLELAGRYWIARSKRRFFRHYWLDIVAVLPFVNAFRVLRLLRLLRLLRVGILLNRNLGRFSVSLAAGISAQIGLLFALGLVVLTGWLGIYLLEGSRNPGFNSLSDAFWWSLLTLVAGEPVGAEPLTLMGRLFTLLIMLGGLTMFAVFTGVVSAVMVQRLRTVMEFKALELDELREHILICGWNRGGLRIMEELMLDPSMRACPIVVVAEFTETPEQALQHLNLSQLYCYSGDYTRIEVLKTVGVLHASRAILLADSTSPRSDQDRDARTVLAALTIEKLNPAIYTCAQLLDRSNDVQLRIAGVDDVIVADELASHLIATSARNQGSVEVLTELLTVQIGNQIYKLALPPAWVGMSFWKAAERLKQSADALLVAVETHQPQRQMQVNPPHDYRLQAQDQLMVIARQPPNLRDYGEI